MRDFKGNIRFGAGFPIGASSILLAHDFALQSLVCYTFCDRCRGKGAVNWGPRKIGDFVGRGGAAE